MDRLDAEEKIHCVMHTVAVTIPSGRREKRYKMGVGVREESNPHRLFLGSNLAL